MSVERILLYSKTFESAKVFHFAAFKKLLDILINLIIYSKIYMGITKYLFSLLLNMRRAKLMIDCIKII